MLRCLSENSCTQVHASCDLTVSRNRLNTEAQLISDSFFSFFCSNIYYRVFFLWSSVVLSFWMSPNRIAFLSLIVHFRIVRLSTWRFQWCPPQHHVIPFCFIFWIDWFLILFNWRYLLDPWRKNVEDISRLSLKCMTLGRSGLVTCPSFSLAARILRFYCLSTSTWKSHMSFSDFNIVGGFSQMCTMDPLSLCVMMISLRDELRLRRLLSLTRDLLSEQTHLITVLYPVSKRRYRP